MTKRTKPIKVKQSTHYVRILISLPIVLALAVIAIYLSVIIPDYLKSAGDKSMPYIIAWFAENPGYLWLIYIGISLFAVPMYKLLSGEIKILERRFGPLLFGLILALIPALTILVGASGLVLPAPQVTVSPSETPTFVTQLEPTATPWLVDEFNSSTFDANLWIGYSKCDDSGHHLSGIGYISFTLDAEQNQQCWIDARLSKSNPAGRIIAKFAIISATPIDGYAGIRTACGNRDMAFEITGDSIYFHREGQGDIYKKLTTQNTGIELEMIWLSDGHIQLYARDLTTNQLIVKLADFEDIPECADLPDFVQFGGYAYTGKFEIRLDYAEITGEIYDPTPTPTATP